MDYRMGCVFKQLRAAKRGASAGVTVRRDVGADVGAGAVAGSAASAGAFAHTKGERCQWQGLVAGIGLSEPWWACAIRA